MEKKNADLTVTTQEKEKSIQAFLGRAKDSFVKIVDQNNDGAIDKEDMSVIAEAIGVAAKNTAQAMRDSAEERRREVDRRQLQPIFVEMLDQTDFMLTKLIRVTEMDKRRAESDVCQGSVGYFSDLKDLRIVNIFKDKTNLFGLTFYPDADCELYYVDPSDRDRYIALDDYFDYLKVARVSELQKIAQDLGAKHFKVTYKEQQSSFANKSVKAKTTGKVAGNAVAMDMEQHISSTVVSSVEVAAEMDCPGHEPVTPELHYLQRETSIQNLVALRMDKNSPLTHQKYTLQLSNSSGIKEKDAIKIDAALKALKISGNTTVTNEVRNESKRIFEYEIDF